MKDTLKTMAGANLVGAMYKVLTPKQVASAELFSDEELKEIRNKEKENEKSINKYMGGSLNKGRK